MKRSTYTHVLMLLNLFETYWMNTLLIAKPIKPVEEETNILLNYNRRLAVDQYAGVKKRAHVRLRTNLSSDLDRRVSARTRVSSTAGCRG